MKGRDDVFMASTTQSNILYSNEIFRQYLFTLSTDLVWKNMTLANSSEDQPSMYLAELFVTANRGLMSFDIIKSFPKVVLKNCGITDSVINVYAADKNKIPMSLRDELVKEYSRALSSKNPVNGYYEYFDKESGTYVTLYNEKNNYYRMLMGLPNVDDMSFIYNNDPRWDTTTPIHKLPLVDRIEMDSAGILNKLYKENPTKHYLKYAGLKNIDFFTSRIAERFEILYRNNTESDVINLAFDTEYNRSRMIVNNVYYSTAFKKTNSLYENFLAMSILFMTLQAMNYRYLQTDITRDFYDTESIKLVYDSYKVPFYTEIPLEYHRKIIKNINRLISYKGSSQVFFDLFDIFDVSSMDIYSYFLTKTHRLDNNGTPLFIPKLDSEGNEMYDEEGHLILDPSNYDIKFSKVKIYDDPALASADPSNDVEYGLITNNDPYWIEDAALQEKLKNESFNYTESKYIGIQTVFNLMNITFENAYIFRMITDNKELTKKMRVHWMDVGIDTSIFSMFTYLSALYCRYYGYTGSITDHIPALMETFGYNFQDSVQVLSEIRTDPILSKNKTLIDTINSLKVTNVDSLDINYKSMKSLRDIIATGYFNSKNKKEYNAYRNLYNTLMISKEVEDVYTNPETGEIFDSFLDVLNNEAPDLMQRYLLLNDNEIMNELTLVIDQIEMTINNLAYLQLSAGISSSTMINSLFKILTFFKSAKCDLIGYNVNYVINSRSDNFFKMMDCLELCYDEGSIYDEMDIRDLVKMIYDFFQYRLEVQTYTDMTLNDSLTIRFKDEIKYLRDHVKKVSYILQKYIKENDSKFIDIAHKLSDKVRINSLLLLSDTSDTELLGFVMHEYKYTGTIKDNIQYLVDKFYILDNPDAPNMNEIIEIAVYIDLLRSCIDSIREKNDTFKSVNTQSDILIPHSGYVDSDIAKFQDVIKQVYLSMLDYSSTLPTKDEVYGEYNKIKTILKDSEIYKDRLIDKSGDSNIIKFFDIIDSLRDKIFVKNTTTNIMDLLILSDSIHIIKNYFKYNDQMSVQDFVSSSNIKNLEYELNIFTDSLYEVDESGSMVNVE